MSSFIQALLCGFGPGGAEISVLQSSALILLIVSPLDSGYLNPTQRSATHNIVFAPHLKVRSFLRNQYAHLYRESGRGASLSTR